jgi:hypothetical protein
MPVDYKHATGSIHWIIDNLWTMLLTVQEQMLDEQPLTNQQVIDLLPSVIEIAKLGQMMEWK